MQHAMMRPAEIEIGEDGIGIAGEIAIGKEQQLGELEQLGLRRRVLARVAAIAAAIGFGLGRAGHGFI